MARDLRAGGGGARGLGRAHLAGRSWRMAARVEHGAAAARLADPNLVQENRRPLKDIVAVVVDRSESQDIGERPQQTDKARDELEARLKTLGDVDLRVVETSRDESETEGTKLFAALRGALSDAPPERVGGAIMITDGDAHDIPQSAAALGFNAPLHALITGHEGERQRRIELVEAPRYGIVGKDQVIEARVLDSADHGEPVKLTVRRDGETIATIDAKVGERIDVKAPIDHPGPNVIELEVAPVEGEIAADSNRAVVNIEGVRDKLRVLLVSGKPHPGERMWRNLLKSDANVDLVHFTILRPPEKGADGTPINELSLIAFPVADLFGRRIKDFDLIIFDRYAQQSILPYVYLENIAKYVRDGGALLMAEGPEFSTPDGLYYSPLGAISPAEPSGDDVEAPYRARVSDEGQTPPGDPGFERFRRQQRRTELGPMVPARRREADERRDGDERRGRQAAPRAVARRQGARGPAVERPDVALGARL